MIKICISEEHYSFLNDIKSCFENSQDLEIRANYSRKSSVDLPMQIIIHLQDISVQDVVDWSVKGAVSGVAAAVGKDVYSLLKSGIKKVCQKFKDSSLTIIYKSCWYQLGQNKKIKLTHPFEKSAEFGEKTIDEFFSDFGLEANPESADWRECKLSDIAEIIAGYAFKSDHFGDVGFRVVKIKDIKPPIVDIENSDRVDLACYSFEKLTKYKIEKGDFVVAMTGATIGKVGKVVSKDEAFINQRVAKISPLKNVDKNFIYYSLVDDSFGQFIQNNIDSHSAQENISGTSIGRYPILLPPLPEQKAIAEVLTSLDDKIDLLSKQNKTLEQLAETLFRQHFIVGAQDDWKEGNVTDEFSLTMGQSPSGNSFNEEGFGIPMFQGNADFEFRFPNKRIYTTEPKKFAEKYDTLISVRAPVGEQNMASERCCIGRGVAAFRYKNEQNFYSYTYFKMKSLMEEIKQFNQTGTVFGSISKTDFENLKITIPSFEEVSNFQEKIFPIDSKIITNCGQIKTLEKLRDQLLPKLMSGEIRIN
jgi:type I restriction enzyme S subunit